MTRRRLRHTLAAAFLVATPLALTAGCGDDEATPTASETRTDAVGGSFNDADVTFATEMMQHHAQALVMVDMTQGRDLDADVAQLMEQIRAAQAPEIEQMVDLLVAWDEPVPETARDHANAGHGDGDGDHGDDMDDMSEMPGMMTDQQLDELDKATDTTFRTMLLEMMIEHHEGAVTMARTEQQKGVSEDAIALAEQIEVAQIEEIGAMQELLEA